MNTTYGCKLDMGILFRPYVLYPYRLIWVGQYTYQCGQYQINNILPPSSLGVRLQGSVTWGKEIPPGINIKIRYSLHSMG